MKKINYFVYMNDEQDIYFRRWYVDEINILKEKFNVDINVSPRKINRSVDLYFSWWGQTSLPSVLISKFKRKPSIVVAGGSEVTKIIPNFGYNSKGLFKKILIKLTLSLCTKIVAVSEFNKKEITDLMGKKYNNKIKVLYHCVSNEYFTENNESSNNDKYILMITALNKNNIKRKCVKESIEAISEVKKAFPNIKLKIIGKKEEGVSEIIEKIEELGLEDNIDLLGALSEDKKIEYLRNAYCYLQPTFHEQFGVAIAEAMATGCPVITTNVAAVPEVVADTGILVENNNTKNITAAIKKMYSDSNLRNQLSCKSRERALVLFSFDIKKENLLHMINELL